MDCEEIDADARPGQNAPRIRKRDSRYESRRHEKSVKNYLLKDFILLYTKCQMTKLSLAGTIDVGRELSRVCLDREVAEMENGVDLLLSECDIVSNTVRQKLRIVSLPSDHAPAFSV